MPNQAMQNTYPLYYSAFTERAGCPGEIVLSRIVMFRTLRGTKTNGCDRAIGWLRLASPTSDPGESMRKSLLPGLDS